MLNLNTRFAEKYVSPDKLAAYAESSAEVLARCQAGEGRYADSQGWLDVDEWAGPEVLARTEQLATHLRALCDTFVIIGVGGSNNSARAVVEALHPHGARIVYAGNTLSAHELNRVIKDLEGHDVVIDCIAKNFETLEPGSSFRLLRQYLVNRYGREEASRRIVCTGTMGSSLERLCRAEGYTFVPFATNVGGRYTALTEVHLLPLAVAGADICALVSGARKMQEVCRGTSDVTTNSAWRYACLRNMLWDRGYRTELLGFFEPRFRWFSKWWEQLFAESEGKDGKGIFPSSLECSEELHSLGQYAQDGTHQLFETFLDLLTPGAGDSLVLGGTDVADSFDYLSGKDFWDINKASFAATRAAHAEVLPVLTLELDRIDEEHFGMLFYWFAFSCYASGSLLGVNPFDQPGVEAYKRLMFEALGK